MHGLEGKSLEPTLDVLREQQFNALRVPLAVDNVLDMESVRPTDMHDELNADLLGKTYVKLPDADVLEADKRDMPVLLDMHRQRAAAGFEERTDQIL